ncbi:unnamed protein product [Acanthoscelides obtectus]|uniref:Membralin n=1 Tax=Acanthoscelides obtectus TaxID=200917 RepID=A0A9P0LBQ9_ACAOB|nr:unnamed protein product [Acanthoscelides obtectus]CAK1641802.1 Membralin [Acanthoscelides obtectus]
MSGNAEAPAMENHPPGPVPGTVRVRNDLFQNPLFNVRDRLFHTLFFRAALAYARTFPRPLRRFIEFLILIKAIAAFFVLVYIHVAFSRTPSTCLMHVKDTWPRDGILRVEIVRNAGKDYSIEQSYAKEEMLKQQGKTEDFAQMIGLLARDGFINIEPSSVEDTSKETQPLVSDVDSFSSNNTTDPPEEEVSGILPDSLANISSVFPTVWPNQENEMIATEQPHFPDGSLDSSNQSENATLDETQKVKESVVEVNKPKGWHDDEYIVEFSLEYGFLRLNPATRARLKIPVEIVFLDPTKDECFGDAFSRLILEEFLGYDDLLLASIKSLAEKEDNKGYLRNVVSGEHYRFVSMWMARTSYFAAFFIMIVFTVSVSMLLRYSHHQIFVFIGKYLLCFILRCMYVKCV